ncbi:MAG: hypothetical protein C0392_12705 [Syntrophus sp. (in: bacteria)]|nr:hypothetical protein [Syntrophus sp. (in: bacteria)]
MKLFIFIILFIISAKGITWAQNTIEVFPSASYDRFIIFQTLALFWIGIIGCVIIIKMKLREIERTQKMGIYKEEKTIPLLD